MTSVNELNAYTRKRAELIKRCEELIGSKSSDYNKGVQDAINIIKV